MVNQNDNFINDGLLWLFDEDKQNKNKKSLFKSTNKKKKYKKKIKLKN
jgi:hypothetical protein|tara:strand:+ start:249 stop:392 length:144 start_codon:yes stop_codon:yes gene_type:complete